MLLYIQYIVLTRLRRPAELNDFGKAKSLKIIYEGLLHP